MRFSERIGMVPQRQIQENSIDERLRTRIVNYISDNFKSEQAKFVLDKLGLHTYKTDPLSFELSGEVEENIQSLLAYLEGCAWYNVYDAIEMGIDFINFSYCDCCEYDGVDCFYAVDKFGEKVDSPCEHIIQKRQYTEDFNSIFEQEKSAYRFVSGQIVPITNEIELDEIERAIGVTFDTEYINTFTGYIFDRLKGIPDDGQTNIELKLDNISVTIKEIKDHQVVLAEIKRIDQSIEKETQK